MTGATGFLGTALTQRLIAMGVRVRVLARSAAKEREATLLGAKAIVGDITDRKSVSEAVEGVAVVYHLAGRLLIPGVAPGDYHATHVEGTRVVLAACRERASVKRFVHCSTTGVLGVTGERPLSETAPFRPTNVYEATKAAAEQSVREAWESGFPAVIVRPGLVYGPGDLHLLGFFRAVLRRQFRPIGVRPTWLHPIYIEDMTDALVRCADHPAAVGECFHIAGREPVTLATLASTIAQAGGTTLPRGHIPLSVARLVAAVGDRLPPALRRSAPLTTPRLDFLTHSRVYDVAKARQLLHFTAKTDLTTGVERTVAWYRRNHYLPETPALPRLAHMRNLP